MRHHIRIQIGIQLVIDTLSIKALLLDLKIPILSKLALRMCRIFNLRLVGKGIGFVESICRGVTYTNYKLLGVQP